MSTTPHAAPSRTGEARGESACASRDGASWRRVWRRVARGGAAAVLRRDGARPAAARPPRTLLRLLGPVPGVAGRVPGDRLGPGALSADDAPVRAGKGQLRRRHPGAVRAAPRPGVV